MGYCKAVNGIIAFGMRKGSFASPGNERAQNSLKEWGNTCRASMKLNTCEVTSGRDRGGWGGEWPRTELHDEKMMFEEGYKKVRNKKN